MRWQLRIACELRVICRRGAWPNRSSRPAVPLSKIQSDILQLLASHRDPESYVAGSTPLNRTAPRYSGDIDVFHDREDRVAQAAEQDAALLQERGYSLKWLRRDPGIYAVSRNAPAKPRSWNGLSIVIFDSSRRCGMRRSV